MTPKDKLIQILSKAVYESFDFNSIDNNGSLTSGINKIGEDIDNIVLKDIIPFLQCRSINIRIFKSEVYKLDTFYVDNQLWYGIRFNSTSGILIAMSKFNLSERIADKRSARLSPMFMGSEEANILAKSVLYAYEQQCLKYNPAIKHRDKLRNLLYDGKISKHKNVIAIKETNLYDATISESYKPLGFVLVKAADVEAFKAKNNISESFDFSKVDNENKSIDLVGEDLEQIVLNDSLSFLKSYKIHIDPDNILYMKPFTINGNTWYAILLFDSIRFNGAIYRVDLFDFDIIADKETMRNCSKIDQARIRESWANSYPIIRVFETYVLRNIFTDILFSDCGYRNGYLKYSGRMSKDGNVIFLDSTNASVKVDGYYEDVKVILFNSAAI